MPLRKASTCRNKLSFNDMLRKLDRYMIIEMEDFQLLNHQSFASKQCLTFKISILAML